MWSLGLKAKMRYNWGHVFEIFLTINQLSGLGIPLTLCQTQIMWYFLDLFYTLFVWRNLIYSTLSIPSFLCTCQNVTKCLLIDFFLAVQCVIWVKYCFSWCDRSGKCNRNRSFIAGWLSHKLPCAVCGRICALSGQHLSCLTSKLGAMQSQCSTTHNLV